MKVLYLDCASGASGDMLLGALVDLGLDPKHLKSRLRQLPLKGYAVTVRRTRRQQIGAVKLDVKIRGRQPHRGLKEIRQIVDGSDLPMEIRRTAMRIFRRIIRAEAGVHRIPENRVHLHEVGAVDAIVDIMGAVIGFSELIGLPGTKGAGRIVCSPLNVGSGTVRMSHGVLPVPAPATVELLRGIPTYSAGPPGEKVTPTGAAIVSTLASSFSTLPPMTVERTGHGAGSRDFDGHPNILRAMLGTDAPGAAHGDVMVLECTIDDMNPQVYGYLMERLFDTGAHEVFYTPVQMKKNRPGVLVTAIGPAERLQDLARVIFEETTTIGLRYRPAGRIELSREMTTVTTPFGRIRMKISAYDGRVTRVQPEYEDCRRHAARRKVPLEDVRSAALEAYRRRDG